MNVSRAGRLLACLLFLLALTPGYTYGLSLAIDTPIDGQTYTSEILVVGWIESGETNGHNYGTVSLVWTILGTPLSGETSGVVGEQFVIRIPSANLTGDRILLIGVGNTPENYATVSLTLTEGEWTDPPPRRTWITEWGVPSQRPRGEPEIRVSFFEGHTPISEERSTPRPPVIPEKPAPAIVDDRRLAVVPDRETGEEPHGPEPADTEAEEPETRPSTPTPPLDYQSPRGAQLSTESTELPLALRPEVLFPPPETAPVFVFEQDDLPQFYRDQVRIEGRVLSSAEEAQSALDIEALQFTVPGTDRAGRIPWDFFDGSFQVVLDTREFSGTKKIVLMATNSKGLQRTEEITLFDGGIEPEISIRQPGDRSPYGRRVRITGRVTDPSPDLGQPRGITEARYEIYAEELGTGSREFLGDLDLDDEGNFEIVFSSDEMFGIQDVDIHATSVNGMKAMERIQLVPGAADIPDFTVVAGDRRITARWSGIPGVDRYDLLVDGVLRFTDVTPPLVVDELENGRLYTFLLRGSSAVFPESIDSEEISNAPLPDSGMGLSVTGEYQRMRLVWDGLDAYAPYRIFRSTRPEGPFLLLTEVEGTEEYVDTDVRFGIDYYYRVAPAFNHAVLGEIGWGHTERLPESTLVAESRVAGPDARDVAILGDYALVVYPQRLGIVDIYDPQDPREISTLPISDGRSLSVIDTLAVIADGSVGLKTVELFDPGNPKLIGSISISDVYDIAEISLQAGGRKFCIGATGRSGLALFEVFDDRSPQILYETEEAGEIATLVREGATIFATGSSPSTGISVWSIDSSSSGVPQITLLAKNTEYGGQAMAVIEDRLFVAGEDGINVLRFDSEHAFEHLSTVPLPKVDDLLVRRVPDGRELLYAAYEDGLVVYDVFNPSHPVLFGTLGEQAVQGVAVRYDLLGRPYAYLATGSGMTVVDVYVLGRSFEIAYADSAGTANTVESVQLPDGTRIAAVVDGSAGFSLFDVTRPSEGIRPLASISGDTVTDAHFFTHPDGRVFLFTSTDESGVGIYLLSELLTLGGASIPYNRIDTEGSVEAMGSMTGSQGESLILVGDRAAGLMVFDFSDPVNVELLGQISLSSPEDILPIDERYVAVTDYREGLVVVDLKDPEDPRSVASIAIRGAGSIDRVGDFLVVAGDEGVSVVSFDATAERLSRHGLFSSRFVEEVASNGEYACIAEGVRGFSVLDISNPAQPIRVSGADVEYATGVDSYGEYALVTDGDGLRLIQVLIPHWLVRR